MTEFIPSSSPDLSASPSVRSNGSSPRRSRKRNISISPPPENQALIQAIRSWRKRDNREWSDVEVKEFPAVFFYNLHQEEWSRKAALGQKLLDYLAYETSADHTVLEAGAGSGWFSHLIASRTGAKVIGLEIDGQQHEQAKKLFSQPNLTFRKGDFYSSRLRKKSIDHLILFDTLPWMGSLDDVTRRATQLLKNGGRIHIIETSIGFPSPKKFDKVRASFEQYCQDKRMSDILGFFQITPQTELERLGYIDMNGGHSLKSLFGKKPLHSWYMRRA